MELTRSEILRFNAVSVELGKKFCKTCKQFKDLSEFYQTQTRNKCKTCFNKASTERRRERVSGWSSDKYKEAFEKQQGLCAIVSCGNAINAADHCHETGEPRELLCKRCNALLGYARDSAELLQDLSMYLRTHSQTKEII